MISLCVLAFLVVFVLLAVLAFSMMLIGILFPAREAALDSALIAAITGTVSAVQPGARVTKIEEVS